MDRRKLSWITWVFVVLTVLVLVMMLMDTLHGPDGMVLPDTSTTSGQTGEIPTPDGALAVVEVSPSTVQAAVKTLARPEAYRRTVTVEQLVRRKQLHKLLHSNPPPSVSAASTST